MFAQLWDCVNTTELRAWRGPIELPIRCLSIPPGGGGGASVIRMFLRPCAGSKQREQTKFTKSSEMRAHPTDPDCQSFRTALRDRCLLAEDCSPYPGESTPESLVSRAQKHLPRLPSCITACSSVEPAPPGSPRAS